MLNIVTDGVGGVFMNLIILVHGMWRLCIEKNGRKKRIGSQTRPTIVCKRLFMCVSLKHLQVKNIRVIQRGPRVSGTRWDGLLSSVQLII